MGPWRNEIKKRTELGSDDTSERENIPQKEGKYALLYSARMWCTASDGSFRERLIQKGGKEAAGIDS